MQGQRISREWNPVTPLRFLGELHQYPRQEFLRGDG